MTVTLMSGGQEHFVFWSTDTCATQFNKLVEVFCKCKNTKAFLKPFTWYRSGFSLDILPGTCFSWNMLYHAFFPFSPSTVEGVSEPHPLCSSTIKTHHCLDSVLRVTLTEELQETNNFEILENFSFKLFHTFTPQILELLCHFFYLTELLLTSQIKDKFMT